MSGERKLSVASQAKKERMYALPTNKPKARKESTRLCKGKYIAIITGAGHGIGKAIASLAFQDQGILPDAWAGSKLVLLDIDEAALNETAGKKMRQFLAHRKIEVDLITIDLSDINQTIEVLDTFSNKYDKDYERCILVNSAGSLGAIEMLREAAESPLAIQQFCDLNITSKMCITQKVCSVFEKQAKTVVDITSIDLHNPTPTLGLACMASSAISMFDDVFAKENPDVRVLHYVTKRLDSNTVQRIIEKTEDKSLAEELQEQADEGKLMPPLEAAKRMIKAFENVSFQKGEVLHISSDNSKDETIKEE